MAGVRCCGFGPGSQDRDVGAVDIRSLVEAPDRHLWLSAYGGGLRRYDPATGVFELIRETPLVAASPAGRFDRLC
jgi:hypothetical protein